jgi:hypothetical protein
MRRAIHEYGLGKRFLIEGIASVREPTLKPTASVTLNGRSLKTSPIIQEQSKDVSPYHFSSTLYQKY